MLPDKVSALKGLDRAEMVDAILKVGRERKEIMDRLRVALESGNQLLALSIAKKLCGIDNEESPRIN
jgi:hypothetical protein